jgi:protein-S-isoprenylcysteine O-methyltransferase Ste14
MGTNEQPPVARSGTEGPGQGHIQAVDVATLRSRSLRRMGFGTVVMAAMLFMPAGSWKFWQGWVVTAVACFAGVFYSLYFCKRDPRLLERRMQKKEEVPQQRLIVRLLILIFYVAFLIPGLDYRVGWSRDLLAPVPAWMALLAQAMLVGCFSLFFWVMDTNSFASRTIRVEAEQKLVSTGPYRWVRHPMYLGLIVMYLCMPLALGSYAALPVFALLAPVIVFRLLNEEALLRRELPGYTEYCARTRFRLVPWVW